MKRTIIFIFTLIIPLILVISGCVESLTPPDKVAPVIELFKPASNDTVILGKREVSFYASDDQKLAYIEIWVNYKFHSRTNANSDGTFPAVIWTVDSNLVYQRVSYYLVAVDNGGNSAQSEVKSNLFVSENTTPPTAPKNLFIRKMSQTAVNLAWDDSSDNEKGFEIWRKKEKTGTFSLQQTLPKNSTSTNDMSLDGISIYYYKVRAFNDFGSSESNEMSTIGAIEMPVYNLAALPVGKTQVALTWNTDQTSKLGFLIQRKTFGSSYSDIAFAAPNATSFDDTVGLTSSTTYYYRVCARYQSGSSDWSNEASVTTLAQDLLPPSGLTAIVQSGGKKVVLNWTVNMPTKETRIERSTNYSGPYTEIGKVDNSTSTFVDSNNIAAKNTYYYRVRSILWSTGGFTVFSNIASVTINITPPAAPGNLSLKVFSDNPKKFFLVWTDNSNDEDGFELWRQDGEGTSFKSVKNLDANSIATNDSVPLAGIIYYYKIRAFRDTSYSDFSNVVNSSGNTGGLAKPTNLRTTTVSKNTISMLWDYPSYVTILGFEIQRTNPDFTILSPNILVSSGQKQYTDTNNITAYQTYRYKVRANTNQGNSDWSNEIIVTTPATQNLKKRK